MAALSAVVFTMSWWLGLYLLARDPRKPVLVLAAIRPHQLRGRGRARRRAGSAAPAHADLLSRIEIYLVAVPAVAWFAVLVELSRPSDSWRSRVGEMLLIAVVAVGALAGALMAGDVNGPLRAGHWVMFAVISVSTLGAMIVAVLRRMQPGPVAGFVIVATLFFALSNAILIIPLGLVPSWLALASTGCDVAVLGLAVALWDAFDEGQALRADMLRSFAATGVVVVLFGGQALIGLAVIGPDASGRTAVTRADVHQPGARHRDPCLLGPARRVLDRVAFWKSPVLRADRAALRSTEAALPLRRTGPLDDVDDDAFARLTRRALGHYGDLSKLVASPLTALPEIDERLARRGVPDQPFERANELKALLADRDRPAQATRRRRLRHQRRMALLQRAVFPVRRRRARLRAERHRGRASTRWPARRGSGSSPRCRSGPCTTGRTRPPG